MSRHIGFFPRLSGGTWFIIIGGVLWGSTGTSQALAPEAATPFAFGAVRLLVAGLAMLVWGAWTGSLRGVLSLRLWPTLLATLCVAAYQMCFFWGVSRTGVAVGTIAAAASSPIMTGLLAWLIRGEQPGFKWVMATALAVAGSGVLIGSGGDMTVDPVGVLLTLMGGVAYALYAVMTKSLLENHRPDAIMTVVFCGGAILLSPVLLVSDLSWLTTPRGMTVALYIGLLATAVPYTLFVCGLKSVPSATAVTLSLVEPLTAGILGVALLGERLSPQALVGIALLFTGLAWLAVGPRPARPTAAPGSPHAPAH